jgi:hypothetical protein
MRLTDKISLVLLGAAFFLITVSACNQQREPELMLYDFNRQADLDRLSWSCRAFYALDKQHGVDGFSLRLEMYPAPYPGLKSGRMENNWTGYRLLCLEIFNPGPESLSLACRLDDRRDNPPYADRVNLPVMLHPGANKVRLDLTALRTSGTRRPLDLSHIYGMYFFLCSPEKKVTLFIDNIRLCRHGAIQKGENCISSFRHVVSRNL